MHPTIERSSHRWPRTGSPSSSWCGTTAAVDWSSFDLVVVRSTWDYPARRAEFLQWAATVPRLANPLDVLTWSSDKHYLHELAAAGVAVVDSTFIEPDDDPTVIAAVLGSASLKEGGFVVKPAVGAGSIDAGRYDADTPGVGLRPRRAARAGGAGGRRPALPRGRRRSRRDGGRVHRGRVQPRPAQGGTAQGPAREVDALYIDETVHAVQPTVAQIDLARRRCGSRRAAIVSSTPGWISWMVPVEALSSSSANWSSRRCFCPRSRGRRRRSPPPSLTVLLRSAPPSIEGYGETCHGGRPADHP